MSISKIRIGNQISLQWTIKQGDSAYDLSAKQNKVYLIAPMARYEVNNFTLSGNSHNIINITWRGVEQHYCGEYHLLLVSVGSNGENMFSIDSKPCFILTPVTDQSAASTATTVQLTDNIMMPSSGESLYEMMVRNGLFEGTEAEFLQEYEDKLDACETATDAANDAATDADTAAGNAITAAATANSAATNANTKAQLAQTKADLADSAATNANTKADAAHTAAVEAASAAELAETKAGLANSAASSANSAASSATSAASAATSAAQSATSAASSATSAASSANSAASSANTAATGASNVNATLSGTNLTITDREGNSTTVNTKGDKGDPGEVTEEEFTQFRESLAAVATSGSYKDLSDTPTELVVKGKGSNSNIFNGGNNSADGDYSHAEGYSTSALGYNSHSECFGTTAKGANSHAEGYTTTANNEASHAEGYYSNAAGFSSHAEGISTYARGAYSHAEGSNTETNNDTEHAEGQYNLSNKASTTFGNAGNTLHSVGIGTDKGTRKNAFEIMQNGDVYVLGLGGYDGTNANAEGVKTIQALLAELAEKDEIIATALTDLNKRLEAVEAIQDGNNTSY